MDMFGSKLFWIFQRSLGARRAQPGRKMRAVPVCALAILASPPRPPARFFAADATGLGNAARTRPVVPGSLAAPYRPLAAPTAAAVRGGRASNFLAWACVKLFL